MLRGFSGHRKTELSLADPLVVNSDGDVGTTVEGKEEAMGERVDNRTSESAYC